MEGPTLGLTRGGIPLKMADAAGAQSGKSTTFDDLDNNFGVEPGVEEKEVRKMPSNRSVRNPSILPSPCARCASEPLLPWSVLAISQDDKLMRAEDMLALVGGDHSLSRGGSGSFGLLFSDEASQNELQRAMNALQDDLLRPSTSFGLGRSPAGLVDVNGPGASPCNRGAAVAAASAAQGWLERCAGSSRSMCSASSSSMGGATGGAGGGAAHSSTSALREGSDAPRQTIMPTHAEPRMQGSSPPRSGNVSPTPPSMAAMMMGGSAAPAAAEAYGCASSSLNVEPRVASVQRRWPELPMGMGSLGPLMPGLMASSGLMGNGTLGSGALGSGGLGSGLGSGMGGVSGGLGGMGGMSGGLNHSSLSLLPQGMRGGMSTAMATPSSASVSASGAMLPITSGMELPGGRIHSELANALGGLTGGRFGTLGARINGLPPQGISGLGGGTSTSGGSLAGMMGMGGLGGLGSKSGASAEAPNHSADAQRGGPEAAATRPTSSTLVGLAHEAAVAAAAASAASALSGSRSSRPNSGVHVAAAAAASAASRLIHAEAEASGVARGSTRASSINRRAWSQEEDDTIRQCVTQMGMRWRLIAPLLPGRSDDSVRNRWKRLKEEADAAEERAGRRAAAAAGGGTAAAAMPAPNGPSTDGRLAGTKRAASSENTAPAKRHTASAKQARRTHSKDGGDDEESQDPGQRTSWSSYEDQVIVRAVQELGPRWCAVAARLPARTDQAVRNRWNRLQQRARVQARTMLNAFQQGQSTLPAAPPAAQ